MFTPVRRLTAQQRQQNAERTTVKTKIAEAMSNYKSLDFAKKNQKFHKVFGRNLDITDCSVSGVSSNSFKNFCVFVAIEVLICHGLTRVAS